MLSPEPSAQKKTADMSLALAALQERSLNHYQSLDYLHGPVHGERVAAAARIIQRNTPLSERADDFLVSAGSWLHQYHAPHLEMLDAVLKDCKELNDRQRDDLYNVVLFCRPHAIIEVTEATYQSVSPRGGSLTDAAKNAARVVFDADALDLIGPSGLVREVRCNTDVRGLGLVDAIQGAYQVIEELFATRLQTAAARTLTSDFSTVLNQWYAVWKSDPESLQMSPTLPIQVAFNQKFLDWESLLNREGARSYYPDSGQATEILFGSSSMK